MQIHALIKENKMNNTIKITNQYNDNMIPCVIFNEFEPILIFVDPNTNTCCKNNSAIVEWLYKNNITIVELYRRCDTEYEAIDPDAEYGIFAYFSEDAETIYNFSKTIDLEDSYEKIFNF